MVNTLEVVPQTWNWNEKAGITAAITGLLFEMVADHQKSIWHRIYASERPDRLSTDPPVCANGLWRFSRHPNHFGDLCLHWGIWTLVTDVTPFISIAGPIVCTLIVFMSDGGMKLIEAERELQYFSYKAYSTYKANTSLFWPIPPSIYQTLPRVVKRVCFFSEIYD